jgi:urease accessory protein
MTAPILPKTRFLALMLAGVLAATPALAHHPMGGMTPATFMQGLLSGLGHPVIGLDHLAALVGVGLVSSRFARGLTLPAFWVVAMAAGVGLHLASLDVPYAEALVALSVVVIGVAATIRTTLPMQRLPPSSPSAEPCTAMPWASPSWARKPLRSQPISSASSWFRRPSRRASLS